MMQNRAVENTHCRLPSGRNLDIKRPRSSGPLDDEELAYCRSNGVPLLFDPIQIGWVTADCEDDIARDDVVRPWPSAGRRVQAGLTRTLDLAALAARYALRPWREEDAERFVALLDNPKIWELLPENYPAPLTADLARDLIALSNEGGHHSVMAAELDGEAIGQVRLLFPQSRDDRAEAEISYWLGEAYWGRGIASDLVQLFTHRGFEDFAELSTIFGRVHERNTGSARVLTKAGYALEGREQEGAPWMIYRAHRR